MSSCYTYLVFYKKSIVEYWSNYNYGHCLLDTEFMVNFFHQHFDGLLTSIVLMRSHLLTFGDSLISHFSLAVFVIFLFVFFNTFDYDASRCDYPTWS